MDFIHVFQNQYFAGILGLKETSRFLTCFKLSKTFLLLHYNFKVGIFNLNFSLREG